MKNEDEEEDVPFRVRLLGVMLPGVKARRGTLDGGLMKSGNAWFDSGLTALGFTRGGYRNEGWNPSDACGGDAAGTCLCP